MSNGNYDGDSDGTSCRYTDQVLVNGGPPAEHDDGLSWCGKFDVKSLLQDAPVDSIRQRTQVEREESITDSPVPDDDGTEKVDLDFNDGQV